MPLYNQLADNWTRADGCELVEADLCGAVSVCDDWDFAVDGSGDIVVRAHEGHPLGTLSTRLPLAFMIQSHHEHDRSFAALNCHPHAQA